MGDCGCVVDGTVRISIANRRPLVEYTKNGEKVLIERGHQLLITFVVANYNKCLSEGFLKAYIP
jgi:hypothetical protein